MVNIHSTNLMNLGGLRILHGPLVGRWHLLLTWGSASYSSWLYGTCSNFWEDFGWILWKLRNLLSYTSPLDWALVSTVLYHHCSCGWIGHCEVGSQILLKLSIIYLFRYFTRFTEEAFAALVGLIFIVESLKKIFSKYKKLRNFCISFIYLWKVQYDKVNKLSITFFTYL